MTSQISLAFAGAPTIEIGNNRSGRGSNAFEEWDAVLKGDLVAACLGGANLRGVSLRGRDLTLADVTGADLRVADLSDATLVSTTLTGADMREARCWRVNLDGADLFGADLSGANLAGAWLGKAVLDEVDLEGAILRGAAYDRYTRWPSGFDPQAAGALLLAGRIEYINMAFVRVAAMHLRFSSDYS